MQSDLKEHRKKSIFLQYFLQENCLPYKLHFFRSKPNKTPSYWRQTVHFHDSLKSAYECAESMTAQFVELICWSPELHPGVCRAAALDKKESVITHHPVGKLATTVCSRILTMKGDHIRSTRHLKASLFSFGQRQLSNEADSGKAFLHYRSHVFLKCENICLNQWHLVMCKRFGHTGCFISTEPNW